ncbi:MAG: tetratricopeptide repeat protein [Candidatus Omnitrophica bacterium]|nr:tetratricopeptide repeat protein [Candidatus Omnitrophota bacterium]
MKKIICMVCLGLMLAGCQQAPQDQVVGNNSERQVAAKKLFAQGMMLLQQKDLKGAVASLQASIKVDPADPNPYLVLGQILLKAEQNEQAAEFLDQSAKNFPDNGTIFYMLAMANRMNGKNLPAVLAARRSYEIFNTTGDAESARNSAILLEELIKESQAKDKSNQAAMSASVSPKAGVADKK